MADVSTPCGEYKAAAPQWQTVEDACAGEAAVKTAREKYLPKPNPQDTSRGNCERYDEYIKRAVFYGASGRTVEGLTGLAFIKDPEITAPASLDDVISNLDGAGTTLTQHMHDTLSEVVKVGRAGLLVDFPKTEGDTSRAQELNAGVRPTVNHYPATSIINWRTKMVGSQVVLSLVVLLEDHKEFDGFAEVSKPQYRVLRLDSTYVVEIWRQRENVELRQLEWVVAETIVPLGGDGQPLTEIPFTFVGSKNNGAVINKAPMADIASLNVAHYRNSADYEDSVYVTGQPQIWLSGLDETWRDHLEKSGIYIGSRSPLLLPANGQAGMLQAQANTLAKEAMDAKEKQMAALGARLVQPDHTLKTATQQRSEDAVAVSVLSLCCDNVSAAYTRALEWVAMFANETAEVAVSMVTDFMQLMLDPVELTALISGVQSGLLPKSDFWTRLRTAGLIDAQKTDEQIQEEIDSSPPMGLGGPSPGGGGGGAPGADPNAPGDKTPPP